VKKLSFEKPERQAIVGKIQRFFADEMEQDHPGRDPAQLLH
jgi:hypothetical protein